MKLRVRMSGSVWAFLCILIALQAGAQDEISLEKNLLPVDPGRNILQSKDYYIWGSSVVQGEDGKYYMFYSRWPHGKRNLDDDSLNYIFDGFSGWLKYSEIACAVSDRLEGPYTYLATVLKSTGREGRWDRFTMTNPFIAKFGESYYLYYVSTGFDSAYSLGKSASREQLRWYQYNCAQAIGVIKAGSIRDFLQGNFSYPERPIVTVDNRRTFEVANNPSVTEGPDGRYYMMYKSRIPHSHMQFWLAVADKPDAPFTTFANVTAGKDLASEDPCMWFDKKRNCFYAVAKYFSNSDTYGLQFGSLILLRSENGINWNLAAHPEVSKRIIHFKNGNQRALNRLERPFIYCDSEGQPLALFAAAAYEAPKGGDPLRVTEDRNTFNVCIPVKQKR